MSEISDKIEDLISLKRLKGCEWNGIADWEFKIGVFEFKKLKDLKKQNKQYDIYISGERIYKENQFLTGYSNIDFYCFDKENMSIVIKKTLDEEIEKETKRARKKEESIFRNYGKISVFKRIFNFIWRTK